MDKKYITFENVPVNLNDNEGAKSYLGFNLREERCNKNTSI
jgi:hypothetical protein